MPRLDKYQPDTSTEEKKLLFSSPLVNYVDILCFTNDFSAEPTLQNLSQLSSLILTDQRAESKTVCIGSC